MGDCNACLVGWEPDGQCEVFNRGMVKRSRKEYRCCECSRIIPVGSPYERTFTVFEGDAETYHTCTICNREFLNETRIIESKNDRDCRWTKRISV